MPIYNTEDGLTVTETSPHSVASSHGVIDNAQLPVEAKLWTDAVARAQAVYDKSPNPTTAEQLRRAQETAAYHLGQMPGRVSRQS